MGLAISSVSFWTLIAAIFIALSKPIYPKSIHSCSKCGSAGFCWTKPRLRPGANDGSTAIAVSDVSAANHVQSISATYTDVIVVLITPSNDAVAADAITYTIAASYIKRIIRISSKTCWTDGKRKVGPKHRDRRTKEKVSWSISWKRSPEIVLWAGFRKKVQLDGRIRTGGRTIESLISLRATSKSGAKWPNCDA